MTQTGQRDEFLSAYIECALWSSTDDDGVPLDTNYSQDDLSKDALQVMTEDCHVFQRINRSLINGVSESQCGHDFWLTRNGHGSGFWDRDLGQIGKKLTDAACIFRECNLCVTPGGQIDIL